MIKNFSKKEIEQYKVPGAQKVIILKARELMENKQRKINIEKYCDFVKSSWYRTGVWCKKS